MTEILKYLFLLFPPIGAGLFIGGIVYRRRLKGRADACLQTGGTIIGNEEASGGGFDTTPVYRPVVEYLVGNQRFSVTSNVGYLPRKKEGTRVKVLYNPANPVIAFIAQDYFTGATIMLALGAAFVVLGSFFAYAIWSSSN